MKFKEKKQGNNFCHEVYRKYGGCNRVSKKNLDLKLEDLNKDKNL